MCFNNVTNVSHFPPLTLSQPSPFFRLSPQRTEDDAAEAVQAYLEENPPSSPAGLPATSEIKHVGVFQLGNNGTCAYPIKLFTLEY